MSLKALPDKKLLQLIKELVVRERGLTLSVLEHLQEIEQRSLFAVKGFPSLFEYAVKELGYSEAAAHRRISAMRLLKAVPEVKTNLEDGSLSLSTLAQAQSFCRVEGIQAHHQKKELLSSLEGKSSREVEKALAARSQNPHRLKAEKIRPVNASMSQISLSVDEEFVKLLDEFRNLLGGHHAVTRISDLLKFSLKESVEKRRPKAPKTALTIPTSEVKKLPVPMKPKNEITKKSTRFIPIEVKREVWMRDQGECSYEEPQTGKKCGSKYGLEFDHIMALAKGGRSDDAKNLRLRCRAHNLLWATQTYGQSHMQKYVPRMRR